MLQGAVYIYYGQADGTLNMQHGMKLTCTVNNETLK